KKKKKKNKKTKQTYKQTRKSKTTQTSQISHHIMLVGHNVPVGFTKNGKGKNFSRTLETKKPPHATYRRLLYLQIFMIKVDALSLAQ
ncbi:hypothetical protein, partial [Escherichia coli]|uniref:hypothetical protein n=1 Tax=Escherichia coli TaxID=562 RepID=UPI001BAFA280